MSDHENDKLDKIFEQLEKMNRGLYGDEENKQPGLMQKHYELSEMVQKHERLKDKALWFIGVLTTMLTIVWSVVKDYFKSLFN